MKCLLSLFASTVTVLLLAGSPARADFVAWNYNWDRSPVVLAAGTGGVSLTNEPLKTGITGPSDTVATNLTVFSSAKASTPDMLKGSAGKYSLTLSITDVASGKSGMLTFTGMLTGAFSATSANLANKFTSPITQVLVLGDAVHGFNTYTVTLGSYAPPGPPTASQKGAISAHVDVQAGSVVTPPPVPEPATLLLSCVGVTLLGGSAWRKRRLARM
jgi:hypothetical protein